MTLHDRPFACKASCGKMPPTRSPGQHKHIAGSLQIAKLKNSPQQSLAELVGITDLEIRDSQYPLPIKTVFDNHLWHLALQLILIERHLCFTIQISTRMVGGELYLSVCLTLLHLKCVYYWLKRTKACRFIRICIF